MSSTTASSVIAECNNLNLVYKLRLFQSAGLRDAVIRVTQNPLEVLFKKRDRLHVLNNISLQIRRGDRIGILGINGAGKTSLCRCFASIYGPTSGRISVPANVRAVFDTSVGIFPELTGRENAFLLAQFMYPEVQAQHKDIVEEALDFSELGTFSMAPFKTYSNGMQARLYLSMISCRSPDLLILDEVFEGADKFFKEKIAKRIVKFIEGAGAVLFVSHLSDQVERICNRVIVLNNSRVEYDGSVSGGVQYFNRLSPRQMGCDL